MIIFLLLAFILLGLIAIVVGFVLKWVSSLIAPHLAILTRKNEKQVQEVVQTVLLSLVTVVLFIAAQSSCSYGESLYREGQKIVSIEEIAYTGLGWFLLIAALVFLGAAVWRLKIAVKGPQPKSQTRKVF